MLRRNVCAAAVLAALIASGVGFASAPPQSPPPPPLSLADAKAIVQATADAGAEGLASPNLSQALDLFQSPDASARTAAEESLTAAAVAYAGEEHGFRIDPEALDRDLALRAPYDAAADFAAARQAGRVAEWIAAQRPRSPEYDALVTTRAGYAALAQAGGWPVLPTGATLKPGMADSRVPALRQRLATEGYAAAPPNTAQTKAPANPNRFDPALSAALAQFQAHHGLKPDGVLDAATLAELNVSAQARVAAIDANLERMRWLPREMPPWRIEVDAGDPQASLFEPGQPALTMRAIVGQPDKRTPTFVSKIAAIEFNPPWIVPSDIAAKELYPKQRRHPGYFARNDFYVEHGQLIQRAGPKSALGYVKFEVPDSFDVYLHDTPARSLFERDKRWLSHGCVRLQDPRDLASRLLAPQGWDRARVDAMIAAGATVTVPLKAQPPVFVLYRTVVVGADGRAVFRPDVYGWDREILAALASRANLT